MAHEADLPETAAPTPRPTRPTRRTFLRGAVAGAAALAVPAPAWSLDADGRGLAYPFTLGVASGDPLPDGVVLWTRLAPEPTRGGGMPDRRVAVRWEVASDEAFGRIVRRGTATALPALGHSVHVELHGLRPDRRYWYRFRTGGHESPVGRTQTAPAPRSFPEALRFAFVSCNDWQDGYFPVFSDLAEQDLDVVVHLGDYIYEYGPSDTGVRRHEGPEVQGLESYRNRHALYKTDLALQAAHAAHPWMVTWDDHEVENNYANLVRDEGSEPNALGFAERRAAGYQAYYEHMPLRRSSLPVGPDLRLYRRLTYGRLAELSLLDTRQYRSDQPCGDGLKPRETCAASLDPAATMTGPEQERWLLEGLRSSRARWNVLAQQTMLAEYDFNPTAATLFNMDQWDGYVEARRRLLRFLMDEQPSNPVVITGDIHSSWVHDLKADFDDPGSATLGTELVGTSVTSTFPVQSIAPVRAALVDNPHTKYFDALYRGYVRNEITRERWRADYRGTLDVSVPEIGLTTFASFDVHDGQPGAVPR